MTEIQANTSDSDLSTDSWTLLEDSSSEDIVKIESENQTFRQEPTKKSSDNSFLSFDEYLQERLLEHDYEQQEKPQKLRKLYKQKAKKGFKKCKAQTLGISVLISIILGLSAFATLCSTLSQPPVVKKVDEIGFGRQLKPVNSTKNFEQFVKEINRTFKEIEGLKLNKLLAKAEEKQNGTLEERKVMGPVNQVSGLNKIQDKHPSCQAPKFHDLLKPNKIKPKSTQTKWVFLKNILLDTNIHALVSLLMTNIYLFTLLFDLIRKPNKNFRFTSKLIEEIEEKKNMEEITKYLFKQLPFYNAEFTCKVHKKKKAQQAKKINNLATLQQRKKLINDIIFRSSHFAQHLTPLAPPNSEAEEETGKSECQRRFEKLDQHQKKFDHLKQAQKNRVKLLKQKFKNEVEHIRDTEEESDVRAEKINRTSQMFIRKLKFNREKYLLELKKVRELRQKVAEDRKKKKDVSCGSYAVVLPPIYDYGEKFKIIKEKFEKEKKQLPKEFRFQ